MANDEFGTTDLWLAAYLEQMRRERLHFERNDRGIVTFWYAGQADCEALKEQYELDTVLISLPEFHAKVERLLVLIFGPKQKRPYNPPQAPPVYIASQWQHNTPPMPYKLTVGDTTRVTEIE